MLSLHPFPLRKKSGTPRDSSKFNGSEKKIKKIFQNPCEVKKKM